MFIDMPLSRGHKLRPGTRITPTSITIHNTGNPTSTARNERAWLDNPTNLNSNRIASWHYVVDGKEVIRAIPDNEMSYHAGRGNRTSIGVEICEIPGSHENGVKFVAWLLNQYKWGTDKLTTHRAWSGKNCPRLILPKWNEFTQDVQKELNKLQGGKPVERKIKVDVNGVVKTFDGVTLNGRSFAPLRALLEDLGYVVDYDAARDVIVVKTKWAK